jgi:hypothetical protein
MCYNGLIAVVEVPHLVQVQVLVLVLAREELQQQSAAADSSRRHQSVHIGYSGSFCCSLHVHLTISSALQWVTTALPACTALQGKRVSACFVLLECCICFMQQLSQELQKHRKLRLLDTECSVALTQGLSLEHAAVASGVIVAPQPA